MAAPALRTLGVSRESSDWSPGATQLHVVWPDGVVVHTVDVVIGTVVGGVYTVVGTTVVTGELGARVVVVRFDGGGGGGGVGAVVGVVALVVG